MLLGALAAPLMLSALPGAKTKARSHHAADLKQAVELGWKQNKKHSRVN